MVALRVSEFSVWDSFIWGKLWYETLTTGKISAIQSSNASSIDQIVVHDWTTIEHWINALILQLHNNLNSCPIYTLYTLSYSSISSTTHACAIPVLSISLSYFVVGFSFDIRFLASGSFTFCLYLVLIWFWVWFSSICGVVVESFVSFRRRSITIPLAISVFIYFTLSLSLPLPCVPNKFIVICWWLASLFFANPPKKFTFKSWKDAPSHLPTPTEC